MKKMTEQEFCKRCNDIDEEPGISDQLKGLLIAATSGALVVGIIWALVEWL